MATSREITISDFAFEPDTIECEIGDSIVWTNNDSDTHTATANNGHFDTSDIPPGAKSKPQVIQQNVDHSGIRYFCKRHPLMTGWVTVKPPAAAARLSRSQDGQARAVFDRAAWSRMTEIIVGCWVYDMADDFEHALASTTDESYHLVGAAWERLRSWWSANSGTSPPFTDKTTLVSLPRSVLEPFGRRLCAESMSLGRLVARQPDPKWPDTGQSRDPFGKAITIFGADQPTSDAFGREIAYASTAFRIQTAQDRGVEVTQNMIDRYNNAKAQVTPEDYKLLAQHQSAGLAEYFGTESFDEAAFSEGAWRMTLAGEWDQPVFVCWHWLKWMDAYLGVLDTGQVPDLVSVTVPVAVRHPTARTQA